MPHFKGYFGVTQEIPSAQSSPLRGLNQETRVLVHDLKTNSPCIASYNRFSFPQGLGHGQTEAFFKRLLNHYVRASLQGIDGDMGIGR